jgi:hypothetical protein
MDAIPYTTTCPWIHARSLVPPGGYVHLPNGDANSLWCCIASAGTYPRLAGGNQFW